jgi:hypothetical protein
VAPNITTDVDPGRVKNCHTARVIHNCFCRVGATSGDILLSFSSRGLALTFAGLAMGLALAAIAARSMTRLL